MKLVQYEWKKIWTNASVLKIVLFFSIISGVLFWGEIKEDKPWIPVYLDMHNSVDDMGMKEADAWLKEKQGELQNIEEAELYWETQDALDCIEQEIEAVVNYDAYRESIQKRYEENQGISIFLNSGWDQESYMAKIAETYEKLEIKSPMKVQPYRGVQKLLNVYASDFLTIIFLIYLVSVVFLQERKTGKADFALTTLRGKGHLFAAKLVTIYGSLIAYVLLNFCVNLLLSLHLYGPVSYAVAVQSVPDLFSVPYAWTLGQYIVACLVLKLVAVGILMVVAVALVTYIDSTMALTGGIAAFIGISIWMSGSVTEEGLEAVLRFWNVWTFMRGRGILASYSLIRLGNLLIEAVWGVCILVILTFALAFFTGKSRVRERIKSPRKRERSQMPHSIFYYEMKKMWIHQGGLVLFIVCILIQGVVVWQHRDYLGIDEYYYQRYIDRFGERITERTDDNITEEEERLRELEMQLAEETDSVRASALVMQLECRGGFMKYADRVEAICNDGKEEILLKDVQYSILFQNTEVSRMMVILLCSSFAFLIPGMYYQEKETRVQILQKTSLKGSKELWNAKVRTISCYIILLIVIFAGLSFGKANTEHALRLGAPVNVLSQYWNSSMKMPIIVFFAVGILVQCIVAVITAIFLLRCAKKVKNSYIMIGIILGGSVIPTLLSPHLPMRWLGWMHDFFYVFTLGR